MHYGKFQFSIDTPDKPIIQKRAIRIDPDRFQKLIISLRTAKNEGEYDLDKQATSYDDLLDSLVLSTLVIKFE